MNNDNYQIYEDFITENLFEFFWCGDEQMYQILDNALRDEEDINKTLHKYFSKEIFYQTQQKLEDDGLVFDPLKSGEFFNRIFYRVVVNYKKIKANSK